MCEDDINQMGGDGDKLENRGANRGTNVPSPVPEILSKPTPRQRTILDAALVCFGRYGFRRTSMEDLAREAQISRTALYQHFGNKEKLLRALSAHLYRQALESADLAANSENALSDRLFQVLDAKLGFFYELLISSEHGREILDDSNRLCGDITAASEVEYAKILARMIRRAQADGDLAPKASAMSPNAMADFFVQCGDGLMGKRLHKPSPAEYRQRLRQLVDALVVGFGGRSATTR